jgi:hypothetical protein
MQIGVERKMQGLRASLLAFGCWVGLCAVATSAPASTIYDLQLARVGGTTWHQSLDADTSTTGPAYNYDFNVDSAPNWKFTLNGLADTDPSVSSALGITNTFATPQTFVLTALVNVAPNVAVGNLMSGSVTVGVTDANNDGSASLTTIGAGSSLYAAQIGNGVVQTTVQTLDNDPISLTVATTSGSNSLPAANFSNVPAPIGGSAISSQYAFTLSAGESAAFSGVFNVVPEPASLGLFGLAAAAGLLARRRRPTA